MTTIQTTAAKHGRPSQIILGIDPGSRVTGYGVIEAVAPGKNRYLECGVLRVDRRAPISDRLVEIAENLREVMAEYTPGCAAIEDVYFHKNPRSALLLGQARGALLLVIAQAGLDVYSYPPAAVKKAVVGRGRAPKAQVAQMVQALCKLQAPPQSDAADALAVALCHASAHWFQGGRRGRGK
jgi:crossover junction endodeoxyribonuclease RuvC